jgi:LysM repeat protein
MQVKRRLRWNPLIFLRNMAILTVLFVVLATTALSSEKPAQEEEYTIVRQGDTLWGIAIDHNPDTDPRITINTICRLNGLESKQLQPGMRLRLP